MMALTRVVLADDHPFVRIGIRNILQKTGDICVIGEAGDGLEAIKLVEELHPDVVVLDMEMPGLRGIAVADHLQAKGIRIPILVLSAHEDKQFILGMLSSGAAGYLVKEEVPDTLVKAVQGIAKGGRGWVSRRVTDLISGRHI